MTVETIKAKKERYIRMGREALTAAQNYLTEYAGVWDRSHEIEWQNMVHAAEVCLTKAVAMDEVLEVVA